MGIDQILRVCVVYSPRARLIQRWEMQLCIGATVADALTACGVGENLTGDERNLLEQGVWGRKVPLNHVLRDGDRVELYRALEVDPKVARRERFERQGSKSAGLFAKRRKGAAAGY